MCDSPIFDFEPSKQAEVQEQIFVILADDFANLLKDVIKNDFSGLLLEFSKFGDSCGVEFDGGKGEIDVVFHFHAIFDEKFFHDADDGLFGIIFL